MDAAATRAPANWATLGLALVIVIAAAIQLAGPASGDVAWLITANERALDGRQLYVGSLETNPPMAVWLYWLPVLLERLTGLRAEAYVVVETIAASCVSLVLARQILRPIWRPSSDGIEPLCLAIVLLLPGSSFAEREHFIVLALLPGLALAAVRYAGKSPPAWAVVIAGVGDATAIAIKPHFALVVLAVALLVAWRQRSFRPILSPEHWLTAILLVAYCGVIAFAYPAFFTSILPAVQALYLPDRVDLPILLIEPPLWIIYAAGLVAAFVYRRQAENPPAPILLVAAATCILVFAIEGKGWAYQLLPGSILAMLSLVFMMLGGERGPISFRGSLLALGFLTAASAVEGILATTLRPDPILVAVERFGSGLKVGTISTDLGMANPLAREAGDTLVNSNPMMWYARGALMAAAQNLSSDQRARFAALGEKDRQLLVQDFTAQPPDLILAEVPPGYDWLGWARRDPALKAILDRFGEMERITVSDGTVALLQRQK